MLETFNNIRLVTRNCLISNFHFKKEEKIAKRDIISIIKKYLFAKRVSLRVIKKQKIAIPVSNEKQ